MSHAVTESGFARDPQLRQGERRLAELAAEWRGAEGQPQREQTLVAEYHALMHQLIQLGWDPAVGELDYEDTLPDELMPDVYLHRHERISEPSTAR